MSTIFPTTATRKTMLSGTSDDSLLRNAKAITSKTARATSSGTMTYGLRIFTIGNDSTFPAGQLLAASSTVTVKPCALSVGTSGVVADASVSAANVTFVLGTTSSSPVSG